MVWLRDARTECGAGPAPIERVSILQLVSVHFRAGRLRLAAPPGHSHSNSTTHTILSLPFSLQRSFGLFCRLFSCLPTPRSSSWVGKLLTALSSFLFVLNQLPILPLLLACFFCPLVIRVVSLPCPRRELNRVSSINSPALLPKGLLVVVSETSVLYHGVFSSEEQLGCFCSRREASSVSTACFRAIELVPFSSSTTEACSTRR